MAVDYSYFLSGCGPRHIPEAIEGSGVFEGTGRLGPPILMDDPSRTASVTARELGGQDEDATVTSRPDDGERSPAEEDDGAPAGEEAALAARERIAAERARYEQLTRYRDEAAARMRGLQRNVNRAERGSRHGDEAFSQLRRAGEEYRTASDAADAFLREHPDAVPVYAAARRWQALGVCTVPVKDDGSKAPFGEWKQYQKRLPTDEELLAWHQAGTSGLGIVTGRTDRDDGCGIEMFEPEGRAVREGIWDEFLGRIAEAGLTECWDRIAAGYHEKTPGGGTHYYWLCADYSGNIKLATRLATEEELAENPDDTHKTLLETRGRGGYSVAAPTPGSFHETGRPWTSEVLPETIIVITPGEREGILGCARACSKVPKGAIHDRAERAEHETVKVPARKAARVPLLRRPGDVFNERGPDWAELLEPHGWRFAREESDGTRHWTRPGKAGGTSATTGNPQHEGDKFHVFTSSTEFEPDTPYSRFAVYALLEHGGDWGAAAAQLVRDGYAGDKPVRPGVETAVYTFEEIYDLRQSKDGEFWARPVEGSAPAVVTQIGDELKRPVALWWRRMAEAWNEKEGRRKKKAAEEKAEQEAAARAHLESLGVLTSAAAEQAEKEKAAKELREVFEKELEVLSKPSTSPEKEEEEGGMVPVFAKVEQVSNVLFHLEASATQHECIDLLMRVMDEPSRLIVDLCDAEGRVAVITRDGWQVCDLREVPGEPWFRRSMHMAPQVVPAPVWSEDVVKVLEKARKVIGMTPEQWRLALSWLVGGHFPSIDRSGLWFTGPSGAGKTTRGKMLAGWIDPAKELGGRINLKRDERDARTKAMNRYVFSMDNVAHVSRDDSDFWCTLHTGVADEVRQLHTDNRMLSYQYKRIGLGTSLSMPPGFEPDARRRMIHIALEVSDEHPATDKLWQTYKQIKPEVLGALYTVLSGVLKHLDEAQAVPLPGCPEMAAYARRLDAADLAHPGLGLYDAYRDHTAVIMVEAAGDKKLAMLIVEALAAQAESKEGIKLAKDGDLVGAAAELAKLAKGGKVIGLLKEGKPFTPTQLYDYLHDLAGIRVVEGEKWFPANPTWLGHQLTSLIGPLRALGIIVDREKSGSWRYLISCKPEIARTLWTLADAAADATLETSAP